MAGHTSVGTDRRTTLGALSAALTPSHRRGARGRLRPRVQPHVWPLPLAALAAVAGLLVGQGAALAAPVKIQQVSSDPFTNSTSQHQTEVEADSSSSGSTVVAAFQAGRFVSGGGSSGIGFATSSDAGKTWSSGFLPSLTVNSTPAGTYGRATDPSVAHDAAHGTWLVTTLDCAPAPSDCNTSTSISVSRSADGLSWGAPVLIASGRQDHEWIACDNGSANAHYGRCYVSFADFVAGNLATYVSDNGGQTWSAAAPAAALFAPMSAVQPNGTLVVAGVGAAFEADVSSDGGATFTTATIASFVGLHSSTGMRVTDAPAIQVDGAGRIYVVWNDCRFRSGCSANDDVLSTSTDGTTWSAVSRIPIDSVTSGVDHFIPGIGADRSTSTSSGHLAVPYYFFPDAACTVSTCQLDVGYITSSDGGSTWSAPIQLNPRAMALSWLANTSIGHMVGDYLATSFAGGSAVTVFAVAGRPSHTGVLDEHMVAAAI